MSSESPYLSYHFCRPQSESHPDPLPRHQEGRPPRNDQPHKLHPLSRAANAHARGTGIWRPPARLCGPSREHDLHGGASGRGRRAPRRRRRSVHEEQSGLLRPGLRRKPYRRGLPPAQLPARRGGDGMDPGSRRCGPPLPRRGILRNPARDRYPEHGPRPGHRPRQPPSEPQCSGTGGRRGLPRGCLPPHVHLRHNRPAEGGPAQLRQLLLEMHGPDDGAEHVRRRPPPGGRARSTMSAASTFPASTSGIRAVRLSCTARWMQRPSRQRSPPNESRAHGLRPP